MRLWTIQPIEVYELIEKQGYYTCEENKIREQEEFFDSCFKSAYDWLIKKMEEKIGKAPDGVVYPVWAWHTYDWKRKSSDLRMRQGKKGQKMVRLEIEISDKQVVLTDYDAWHFVLNDWYMAPVENEEEYEMEWERYEKLSVSERERLKLESWDAIFDVSPKKTDWEVRGAFIQATFWKLEKEQIKKVKFFTSR